MPFPLSAIFSSFASLRFARADAKDGEEDARLGLLGDQFDQFIVAGRANVEVAVRGPEDAVDAAVFEEVGRRLLVGQLDAGAAVRRAAALQSLDRRVELVLLIAAGCRQPQTSIAGVGHDRDAIIGREFVHPAVHRIAEERQLVLAAHRAADIDQEDQIALGSFATVNFFPLQTDAEQFVIRRPRAIGHFHVDAERVLAVGCG